MNKINGQTFTQSELLLVRKQIVRYHESGMKKSAIASLLGTDIRMVRKAVSLYEDGGSAALKPQKVGRKEGTGAFLTADQEKEIRRLICDKRPEQLKLSFALWDRKAVAELIECTYGVKLKVRSVGEYLKSWGFTPQKPIKRAYQRSEPAVKEWLQEKYPQIQAAAKAECAEIHWCDETALSMGDVRGREYAPKGETPVVSVDGAGRRAFSMISSVTNQGKIRWMIIEDSINSDKFIEFLQSLIKTSERKVFVILDNLRVHHSKPVKAWVEKNQNKIELFFLPSYSPDLNPDEKLNADLKYSVGSVTPVRITEKLRINTERHLAFLEEKPDRVKTYFQAKTTNYAA
ncbi:MAG: IS630 family transposase [Bacteroidota bacterium]